MKKNRCDSRRFWDRRSRIYDAQVIPEYKGTYKKIVKRSAHFLSQEDRILEIGCGTGNATIPLAGYVKKITAIDTSREMLDKAKEKMEKSGNFILIKLFRSWIWMLHPMLGRVPGL